MSSPSPYLKQSLTRWTDRQTAVRQEAEGAQEHAREKRAYLDDLMNQVLRHRREDIGQLSVFQDEAQFRWLERLKRLESWVEESGGLRQRFVKVRDWHESQNWFDRLIRMGEIGTRRLSRHDAHYEKEHQRLQEDLQSWKARLAIKAFELREFQDKQAASANTIFVSAARKKPFIEFAAFERDLEAQWSKDVRALREGISLTLKRLQKIEVSAQERAAYQPARFEIYRQQIELLIAPWRGRFEELYAHIMNDAVLLEEGKRQLRDYYEIVQKMQVIESSFEPKPLRSWLDRVLNYEKE